MPPATGSEEATWDAFHADLRGNSLQLAHPKLPRLGYYVRAKLSRGTH